MGVLALLRRIFDVCGCDINSCFAAIAAAFDDPIVYSLAILRDVAKRERGGKGDLRGMILLIIQKMGGGCRY